MASSTATLTPEISPSTQADSSPCQSSPSPRPHLLLPPHLLSDPRPSTLALFFTPISPSTFALALPASYLVILYLTVDLLRPHASFLFIHYFTLPLPHLFNFTLASAPFSSRSLHPSLSLPPSPTTLHLIRPPRWPSGVLRLRHDGASGATGQER